MGLLGTLIGGGIGFMMGGPLGAILGGAIGSNLDNGGQRARHPGADRFQRARRAAAGGGATYGWGRQGYDPLQAQQAFLTAMISLAAKVAKADGRVTPEEVRSFDHFLQHNLGMGARERRVAAQIFNEARDSDIPAAEFARQIRGLLGHQPDRLRDLITLLMNIAMADGRYAPEEEALIRDIAAQLGLSERDYQEARSLFQPGGNLDEAYTALGVTRETSDADVKKAYRRLAREYHPDVLANKGMSEDFQKFAGQKMRSVNDAYDRVKEARGI